MKSHSWVMDSWLQPEFFRICFERRCQDCDFRQRYYVLKEQMLTGKIDIHVISAQMDKVDHIPECTGMSIYEPFEGYKLYVNAKPSYAKFEVFPLALPGTNVIDILAEALPELRTVVKCPEPCVRTQTIYDIVVHLNDGHQWTREQIADWLETLDADLRFQVEDKDADGA